MDPTQLTSDITQSFVLEDLDIRGCIVRLGSTWQTILGKHRYADQTLHVLGEIAGVTSIIAANLKQRGRITVQLSSQGPISLLVVDCSADLNLRAYAKSEPVITEEQLSSLFAAGQLQLTFDTQNMKTPYQSYVPLVGNSIGEVFEHYLTQSEQQASRLFLSSNERYAAGLFLQKLPLADQKDPDGWNRITQLAQTVKSTELTDLAPCDLLQRLFVEETVRVFTPRIVTHDFPPNWDKAEDILRSLGRDEVESILEERGAVEIHDELSGHLYRFDRKKVEDIFGEDGTPRTLH